MNLFVRTGKNWLSDIGHARRIIYYTCRADNRSPFNIRSKFMQTNDRTIEKSACFKFIML